MLSKSQKAYISLVKRPIGFIGALIALIILSPIFLATMILLFFANKNGFRGIFFTQDRPGKNGRVKVLEWYDIRVMWPLIKELYERILK